MLAGLTTKTGVVGHMSGIKVVPGLKGRAAFANHHARIGERQVAKGGDLPTPVIQPDGSPDEEVRDCRFDRDSFRFDVPLREPSPEAAFGAGMLPHAERGVGREPEQGVGRETGRMLAPGHDGQGQQRQGGEEIDDG